VFAVVFPAIMQASTIDRVTVLPTCTINPDDRIVIEVLLRSGSMPTYLFEPTQLRVNGNEIVVDMFATSGMFDALSSLLVPVDIGSLPVGAYAYTINLHNLGWPDVQATVGSFDVDLQRCNSLPRGSRHLYWADGGGIIKRTSLNGAKIEGLVTDVRPSGFVLDPVARKMYWSDWEEGRIERANVDGTARETLVNTEAQNGLHGLVLDPSTQRLFWVSAGHQIWRSELDGSQAVPFVEGLHSPDWLIVDGRGGKIYWSELFDKIRRANLDGSGIETILSGLDYPRLLTLDLRGRKLYWSTYASAVANGLYRSNLDGSDLEPLVIGSSVSPISMLLHVFPGKMYWTDSYSYGKILRANLDGSDVEDVVTHLPDFPQELTYDSRSKKLYWAQPSMFGDYPTGSIMRANLDGSDVEILADGLDWPIGLSFDRGVATRPKRAIVALPK